MINSEELYKSRTVKNLEKELFETELALQSIK